MAVYELQYASFWNLEKLLRQNCKLRPQNYKLCVKNRQLTLIRFN